MDNVFYPRGTFLPLTNEAASASVDFKNRFKPRSPTKGKGTGGLGMNSFSDESSCSSLDYWGERMCIWGSAVDLYIYVRTKKERGSKNQSERFQLSTG